MEADLKRKLLSVIIGITCSLIVSGLIVLLMQVLYPRWNPGLIRALSRSTGEYMLVSQWIWTVAGFFLTFALSALLSAITVGLFQRGRHDGEVSR